MLAVLVILFLIHISVVCIAILQQGKNCKELFLLADTKLPYTLEEKIRQIIKSAIVQVIQRRKLKTLQRRSTSRKEKNKCQNQNVLDLHKIN